VRYDIYILYIYVIRQLKFNANWLMIDEWENALCTTRTSSCVCWLLRDFSDQWDLPSWMSPVTSITLFSITRSLWRTRTSHIAEKTVVWLTKTLQYVNTECNEYIFVTYIWRMWGEKQLVDATLIQNRWEERVWIRLIFVSLIWIRNNKWCWFYQKKYRSKLPADIS